MMSAVYRGFRGAEYLRFPDEVLVAFVQRRGLGELATFRRNDAPSIVADYGLNAESGIFDAWDKIQNPASASETVRMFDRQRCIAVDPDAITPEGVAFELVRYEIPTQAVGVVERIPTIFESVDALDVDGVPVFSYSQINGEQPCRSSLIHPDPDVDPLTWEWIVTRNVAPYTTEMGAPDPYLGPVSPLLIGGDPMLPSWSDLRYGIASRWPDRQQWILTSRSVVRYWVVLRGEAGRWGVRVGGRLAGYWQSGGRRGAAVFAATHRIV